MVGSSSNWVMGIVKAFGLSAILSITPCLQMVTAQDAIVFQTDKPYYVTGETVYYKIYFPPAMADINPMLELLVFNPDDKLIHSSFLKKEQTSHTHGYYRVPYEGVSGVYQIKAELMDESIGRKTTLLASDIPVYNDSELPEDIVLEEEVSKTAHFNPKDLSVSIEVQPTVGVRDSVDVKVQVKDQTGKPVQVNLSVSVTDYEMVGESPYSTLTESTLSLDRLDDLSEYITLSGQVETKQDDLLMTFFMPSTNQIYYTTSVEEGVFTLLVPGFYGNQVIQYVGLFSEGTRIDVIGPEPIAPTTSLKYTKSVVNYIKQSKDRKLIYQLFNKTESTSNFQVVEQQQQAAPDREFKGSDYPFATLPEFCKELSTPLKFMNSKKRTTEFKMFNPESRNFYFGNPLFIIDGRLTKDIEYLSTLDFQEVKTIKLYYDNQRLSNLFGFAGFSGVVIIESKEGLLQVPNDNTTQLFELQGLQYMLNREQNFPNTMEEPVFRPQLLWEPALTTDTDGELGLTFQQSDDISTFQIEVVVQSEDGRRGIGRKQYKVSAQ